MTREVSDTENDLRREAIRLGVAQWEVPGYWSAMLTRTPVPASWPRAFDEGPQLPCLTVLRQTSPDAPWLARWWLAPALLALGAAVTAWVWRAGGRHESTRRT